MPQYPVNRREKSIVRNDTFKLRIKRIGGTRKQVVVQPRKSNCSKPAFLFKG